MLLSLKYVLRSLVPPPVLSAYHFSLAAVGALLYGFPSRNIMVIGVTGTKGKSSTIEFLNAILEEAGYTTALLSSIRVKQGTTSKPNSIGRSMPGRFFLQHLIDQSRRAGCNIVILEMTSEGARQYRHRFIELDALIFTNLAPEHIESHGSLEAYANAKFEIGRQLVRSRKRPRFMVANADDTQGTRYLTLQVEYVLPVSLKNAGRVQARDDGSNFEFEKAAIHLKQPGEFSVRNALCAATLARALNIPMETVTRGLEKVAVIPGRAQRVEAGQDFLVIVDYAHTPDSLEALMCAYGSRRKICILGSAGGGRDMWKRPMVGKIAEANCAHVILTNDDPYDEDPRSIVEMIERGMTRDTHEIILDRREAIRKGIALAKKGDAVLITGKGIDPIYGPKGKKIPWSDADVAREELSRVHSRSSETAPNALV